MHGNLFNDAHLFKPPVPLLSTYKCAVIRKVYVYKRACSLTLSDFPSALSPVEKRTRLHSIFYASCYAKSIARALCFSFSLPLLFVSSICVSTPRVISAVNYSQWMNSSSRSIDSPISRCPLTCISARDDLSRSARK